MSRVNASPGIRSEEGLAYVAILLLLAMLSAMAMAFLHKVGTETAATEQRGKAMQAHYLAESAANHAMWYLLNETPAVTTVEFRVSHDDDDASEEDDGDMRVNEDRIGLGDWKFGGVRFLNVNIPQGAAIINAYVRFMAEHTHAEYTDLVIYGHDADNAARFATTNGDISNRPPTAANVAWNDIPKWDKDDFYRTPGLSSIIQAIVARPGWSSGNAIAVLFKWTDSNSKRCATSHDKSSANAPLLHVEYTDAAIAASNVYHMHSLAGGRYGYKIRWHTDTTFATIATVGAVGDHVVNQSYVLYVTPEEEEIHPCLVARWKLDETAGTTAVDSVGGHDGTLSGGPVWTTGKLDGALDFDGSNDVVIVPHSDELSLTEEYTLTAWIYNHSLDYYDQAFNKGSSGNDSNYFFGTVDQDLTFGFYRSGWVEFKTTGLNLQTDTWYHIAGIFDNANDNVRLYLNGVEVLNATTTQEPLTNTGTVRLGNPQWTSNFHGKLDDMHIYNCALSPEDIAALYCAGGVASYREFTEAKAGSDTTSITISTPSGTSEGDLLIAAVATDGDTSGTLAPPGGEGWTQIDINDYNGEVSLGAWWKFADASESPSHQFTWSGVEQAYGWMMRFTCHDPTTPINIFSTDGETSSTPTSPAVTTTVGDALILRLGAFDDSDITVDDPGLSGHTAITMDSSGSSAGLVSFEEFTEAKRTSNGTSLSINTPAGTGEGDLLIAAVATDADNSGSLAPPGGEGWTGIDLNDQSGAVTLGVWWKLAGASESSTHQFTWSSSQEAYGWIMRFTGHDPTSPINAAVASGGFSSSPTSPSANTTVANTMIVRIGGFDDDDINVDNPALSGHTAITMDESSLGTGTCSGGAGYTQQAAIGSSGTSSFSLTAWEQYRAVTIAIAPATGGGGGGTVSGGAGYVTQAAGGSSGTSNFSLTASEESRTITIAITPAGD